ncbi:thioesterase domain-containing protein [Streptomyces sp. GbtcB6]|uniref:thioesterase II family protein n=1 Tax=Streptomyces sp. GbtcB6 TaxID=2824751 RepID=UPI0027E46356|nr:thioesterase domain-containing protein [Streptomyces sp. GbtcB6]
MNPARPRTEGDWLLVPAPQDHRPYRLFCFPHAGGDATAFAPLAQALAPAAEVWALRMPARGGRSRHPMPATFDLLVRTVTDALLPHLSGRFGFYGQSFGSLLAYEVARALPPEHRPEVVIAASASPPGTWGAPTPPQYGAEDLLRTCGMGELVASEPELRELALRAIRSDLTVRDTYRYRPGPMLDTALHAVAGDADPMLDAALLAGWAEHTSGAFGLTVVPGGHLLATVQRPGPVGLLTSILGHRPDPTPREPRWPRAQHLAR